MCRVYVCLSVGCAPSSRVQVAAILYLSVAALRLVIVCACAQDAGTGLAGARDVHCRMKSRGLFVSKDRSKVFDFGNLSCDVCLECISNVGDCYSEG